MPLVPCPCCGYRTLTAEHHYEICPICFWEDDPIQFDCPGYRGGANHESLEEARQNYRTFGACCPDMLRFVRRPTVQEEQTR